MASSTGKVVAQNYDKIVYISGAQSQICNGRYAWTTRREGKLKKGCDIGKVVQTDRFENDKGVILERNVDFDNVNWKLWHPNHHNCYSFYWVKADLSDNYDIPPKTQWQRYKGDGKAGTQNLVVEYCTLLN